MHRCFKVDKSQGLIPIANSVRPLGLNQTTPASGPPGTASHIIFSEDNTQLIASVKGIPPQPGFLAVWDIAADGSLSTDFKSIAPQAGGLLPFSMTVIAGKNAILATDAGLGFDIFDLGAEANSSGNVSAAIDRSSANAIAGQSATCWSSFSSKTGTFFLTDIGTSMVTEVSVDANLNATIVKVSDLILCQLPDENLPVHRKSNILKPMALQQLITMSLQSKATSTSELRYAQIIISPAYLYV